MRNISRYLCAIALFFLAASCSRPAEEPIPKPVPKPPAKKPRELVADQNVVLPAIGPLIMIDAGHGGTDTGAKGRLAPEYQEKNLTLTTATMLKKFLSQMGYQTVMMRQTDVFIDRYERARIANRKNPDLFVSIHFNFAAAIEASGIEVFYYRSEDNPDRSKESKRIAQAILSKVLDSTGAKSRGVKHGNYAVVRETAMPAVLIEGGFLTNEDEMNKLKDPAYLKRLAWGIAQGISATVK